MDRDSFDRLMLEHLSAAHRLAIRLCGNVDRAEELVQEAMLKASRGWESFGGRSKFSTWLFQIVINLFRDQLRRKGTAGHVGEVENDRPDPRMPEAHQLASGIELGELIARHVSALPPRQREVLVLVAYERMSSTEVARILGISDESARTNLHFARQTLKKHLAVYLGGEDRCENGTRTI